VAQGAETCLHAAPHKAAAKRRKTVKNITINYDRVRIAGRRGTHVTLAALALCTFAAAGKAQCGITRAPQSTMALRATQTARPQLALRPGNPPGEAPEATTTPASNSIVGFWHVKFVSGGQLVDEGFDQWHSDGTEILNDTPPPATGNVCLGVYGQVPSPSAIINATKPSYKLKHLAWTFDDAGNVNGTAVIGELVSVSANGATFTGTCTLDVYDLMNNLLFHEDGQITGERITVD